MATAYMREVSPGVWMTTVRPSIDAPEGCDQVKVIPTHPSRVRPERKSMLYKPKPPEKVHDHREWLVERMLKANNDRQDKWIKELDEYDKRHQK